MGAIRTRGGSGPSGPRRPRRVGPTGTWLAGEAAFTAFYRVHAQAVLVFFTRRTYDVDAALDLTAETFAQAFAGRRRLRAQSEAPAGARLVGVRTPPHG